MISCFRCRPNFVCITFTWFFPIFDRLIWCFEAQIAAQIDELEEQEIPELESPACSTKIVGLSGISGLLVPNLQPILTSLPHFRLANSFVFEFCFDVPRLKSSLRNTSTTTMIPQSLSDFFDTIYTRDCMIIYTNTEGITFISPFKTYLPFSYLVLLRVAFWVFTWPRKVRECVCYSNIKLSWWEKQRKRTNVILT